MKANRVYLEEMEREGILGHQDQRVNLVFKVCQVSLETKEKGAIKVQWDQKEIVDLMVYLEMMVPLGYQVFQVKWGLVDSLDLEDLQGFQAHLVYLEQRVVKVLRVMKVLQGHLDLLVK